MKSSEKAQTETNPSAADKQAKKPEKENKKTQQAQADQEEDNPFGGMKGGENFRRNMGCGG